MTPDDAADLRHDMAEVARKVSGLEGRVDSLRAQQESNSRSIERMTKLVAESLSFTGAHIEELRRSFSVTEEHLSATRQGIETMALQQGRMLRELAAMKAER